jgi:hypothetical protein
MRTNATCTDRLYQLKRAMHITTLRNFSTINCSDRVNVSRARLRAGSKKHLFDTLLATTLQQTSSMLLPIQDDAEQDSLRKNGKYKSSAAKIWKVGVSLLPAFIFVLEDGSFAAGILQSF